MQVNFFHKVRSLKWGDFTAVTYGASKLSIKKLFHTLNFAPLCLYFKNKCKKKERDNCASYQMAVFAHRVGTAQAVHAVVHVLLAPRPGKAWAAQAVKAIHDWNTTGKWDRVTAHLRSITSVDVPHMCRWWALSTISPLWSHFFYLFSVERMLPLAANRSDLLWGELLCAP